MKQEVVNNRDTDNVIVSLDSENKDVSVISGKDENGKYKSVKPHQSDQFMVVDKRTIMESIVASFSRQFKNPHGLDFFWMPLNMVGGFAEGIGKGILNGATDLWKDLAEFSRFKVNNGVKFRHKFTEDEIDWENLSKVVDKRHLEKTGQLERLLREKETESIYYKGLIGEFNIEGEHKIHLERDPESNKVYTKIRSPYPDLNLDLPYKGYTFTEKEKTELMKNGQLSENIELVDETTGEFYNAIIELDKHYNFLHDTDIENLKFPENIKEFTLSEEDHNALREGKKVVLKNGDKTLAIRFSPLKDQLIFLDSINPYGHLFNVPLNLGDRVLTNRERCKIGAGHPTDLGKVISKNGKVMPNIYWIDLDTGKLTNNWEQRKAQRQKEEERKQQENKQDSSVSNSVSPQIKRGR